MIKKLLIAKQGIMKEDANICYITSSVPNCDVKLILFTIIYTYEKEKRLWPKEKYQIRYSIHYAGPYLNKSNINRGSGKIIIFTSDVALPT